MVALMAVCFAVPAMGKAEAAKVVVLPLVNNSGSETAGQIYISGAIQLFDYPEYELLENDATNDAIAAETLVRRRFQRRYGTHCQSIRCRPCCRHGS